MSNIVEPQITETKPINYDSFFKKIDLTKFLGDETSTPVLCKDGTTKNQLSSPTGKYADACINNGGRAVNQPINPIEGGKGFLDRQNELAKQQAIMEEMAYNNRLTDKVFGKQSNFVSGGGNRFLILPTYVILGTIVGRYVAKNMKKSTTLGMVVGGLAPLLALKLTMEYDKKNMPKQEPKQKVVNEPTPMPIIKSTKPDGSLMPIDWSNTLFGAKKCPNGTKKVTVSCAVAPCPEMEVCA